jgi:tRNA-specific 2-thiouridylase
MNTPLKRKVFVAMSGGVDSSLAAALLKERGFDVEGAFIKTWQIPGLPCSAAEDRRDAMRVAAMLGIPFHTFDFTEEYKRDVVDYMLREYAAGKTPNPDVMCNARIKFGAFLDEALRQGADFIATGHYARVQQAQPSPQASAGGAASSKQVTPHSSSLRATSRARSNPGSLWIASSLHCGFAPRKDVYALLRAKDQAKDQTYFLWMLTQDQLKYCLFPIGDYLKSEVREMARERGLVTADKRESQGLCFLGKIDVRAFLAEHLGVEPGIVLDAASGRAIGEHSGAALYTLGQRHGFSTRAESPTSSPYYVVARDIAANTITVAPRATASLEPHARRSISLEACNWIGETPEAGRALSGRLRHRGEILPCALEQLEPDTLRARVMFDEPLLAASGQSLVLYEGERVVVGGIIE